MDREFIEDSFNLYGLRALVPHYNEALDMILDVERMDEAPSEERQVNTIFFAYNTLLMELVLIALPLFLRQKLSLLRSTYTASYMRGTC